MATINRWSFVLWLLIVIPAAQAETSGYFSWQEGAFKDNQFQYGNLYYEKNNGTLREMKFNWGSRELVRLTGGMRINSQNKIANYALGMIFNNGDQFIVRQFKINDSLIYENDNASFGTTVPYTLTDVDASAKEISYIRTLDRDADIMFTYGQSNFPIQLFIDSSYYIDVKPDTQYLTVGLQWDKLKRMVMRGESGARWYFNGEATFGIISQTLSQNIYSDRYGNSTSGTQKVDKLGIRGNAGYDAVMKANVNLGYAYLFNAYGSTGAVALSVFVDYYSPWISDLLALNKTDTGFAWGLGDRMIYGISGQLVFSY